MRYRDVIVFYALPIIRSIYIPRDSGSILRAVARTSFISFFFLPSFDKLAAKNERGRKGKDSGELMNEGKHAGDTRERGRTAAAANPLLCGIASSENNAPCTLHLFHIISNKRVTVHTCNCRVTSSLSRLLTCAIETRANRRTDQPIDRCRPEQRPAIRH